MKQNNTEQEKGTAKSAGLALVLAPVLMALLSVSAYASYPMVTLQSPGETYVAEGNYYQAPTQTPYQTYNYVDGYGHGYAMAVRDLERYYQPHPSTYRDRTYYGKDVVIYYPSSQYDWSYYGGYAQPQTRGLDCFFGRSDLCLYHYERCGDYWCRTGDDYDTRSYYYYNPSGFPGVYPMSDRSGIYYVT